MMAARPPASARPLLEPRHVRLLGLLAGASFFEGYDLNVVMVALPQIRRSFGLTQAQASGWIALLYLGTLPALFLARRADRHGRRRLLLASITGYTVAMLNALGAGTGALAWGLLLAPHHLSWRWLYLAATPALLVVVFMRRRLPESSRFGAAASGGRLADTWRSLLALRTAGDWSRCARRRRWPACSPSHPSS
jgi:MFS family permease